MALPPAEFVERAMKERLQMLIPYLSRWPQAIAIMSLPPNVPNALATLLTMVDDICFYAGDRSVDVGLFRKNIRLFYWDKNFLLQFNWYLRRIGIAGVYKASELYLIQDKSQDHVQTWKFLNRRLIEAVQLYDLISKSDVATQGAKDAAASAFVTVNKSFFVYFDFFIIYWMF